MVDLELLTSLEPLPGSRSGRTLLGSVAGTRVVARLYVGPDDHGPAAHEVHAALLALLGGLLPVPQVLELRGPRDDLPALLLTEHLPGEPADQVLRGLDPARRERLGRHLGRLAGAVAGVPFARRGGFRDASLQPRTAGSAEGAAEGSATATTEETAEQAGEDAPPWSGEAERLRELETRAALVHGDLGLDNVLVDPDSLVVTGLVDWERAHAGHPRADLGRLLRGAGDRTTPYVAGVLAGWAEIRGPEDPGEPDALDRARSADLAVLRAEARDGGPDADRARALVAAIARHGDVHAVPSGWTGL